MNPEKFIRKQARLHKLSIDQLTVNEDVEISGATAYVLDVSGSNGQRRIQVIHRGDDSLFEKELLALLPVASEELS